MGRVTDSPLVGKSLSFYVIIHKNSQIRKNYRHIDFNDTLVKNHLDTLKILCYSVDKGNQKAKGGFTPPSLSGGLKNALRKKGGRYNVYYIFGFIPILYFRCSPCKSLL